MNPKIILIAIAAGIASSVAVMAASRMGVAGGFLMLAGSFPIYVAALSFGTHAGVAASIMAIVVSSTLMSPAVAVIVGLLFTIPASIVGHQANLAQENEAGEMEWYPLSKLLVNLSILLTLGFIVAGYVSGYNVQEMTPQMTEAVRQVLSQNPPPVPVTDQEVTNMVAFIFKVLPFMFCGMWLITHVINLQLASLVSRASGMMPRPKEDIAATITLPKAVIGVAVISLVMAVSLEGTLQHVAGVVAGVSNMALAIVGLAALHLRARTTNAGFVMLLISYLAIFVFYFPLIFFAIGGVMRIFTTQPNNPDTPPSGG